MSRRRRSRRRALWWVEGILLAAGFVCLGWWGWTQGSTAVDQSWAQYKFEAERGSEEASVRGYFEHLMRGETVEEQQQAEAPPVEAEPAPKPRREYEVGQVVGQLAIPRLKVSGVVRHGMDDKTLKRAIGHLPGTPGPGEGGNMGIAAHRDTFFRNLKGIKIGDRIVMEAKDGTYEYVVDSTKIVMPENVEVLDPTPEPTMTIVTCYPFQYIGNAPKRFIVHARQVGDTTVASSETPEEARSGG